MRTCKNCGMEKEESGFHQRKDGYKRIICIDCVNKAKRASWITDLKGKEKKKVRMAKYKAEATELMNKHRHPCIVCGEAEKACIDLHHLDPSTKYKSVAELVGSYYSLEKIKKEIDKCVCLCANCHRKVHAGLIDLTPYIPTT
jgi:hypothetical protein